MKDHGRAKAWAGVQLASTRAVWEATGASADAIEPSGNRHMATPSSQALATAGGNAVRNPGKAKVVGVVPGLEGTAYEKK